MVYRLEDLERTEREEVIPTENFLQLAALNMKKGRLFAPTNTFGKTDLQK